MRVQQQVETARYDLLWAANWQNITAWRSRVDGGAVAADPDGDNVAFYRGGAEGFERLFAIDQSLLDAKGRESLAAIETNWRAMSDFNDQIFELWAAGRLDEGDAMSTGEKWDVFYVLDQAMTELVKSVDARAVDAARSRRKDADDTTGAGRRPGHRARPGARARRRPRRLPRHRPRGQGGAGAASSGWPRATCPSACRCAAATSSARWPRP